MSDQESPLLRVVGAREHNLKDVSIEIPLRGLIAFTGRSGSGKSSLAFDTIFAESQRRMLEGSSAKVRQMLDAFLPPDVDAIEGLPPAIGVAAPSRVRERRETFGSLTEMYSRLTVLVAREGELWCSSCCTGFDIHRIPEIVDAILREKEGRKGVLLAPIDRGASAYERGIGEELLSLGYNRVRSGNEETLLDEGEGPGRLNPELSLSVVIDRVVIRSGIEERLAESVELCSRLGGGRVFVETQSEDNSRIEKRYTTEACCPECGLQCIEPVPAYFSFFNSVGQCPECRGLGYSEDGKKICAACDGLRLRSDLLEVRLDGVAFCKLVRMPVQDLESFLKKLSLDSLSTESRAVQRLLIAGCESCRELGIEYIPLSRSAAEVSAGELHRAALARFLSRQLEGALYVFDEPLASLHPADEELILAALERISSSARAVIAVEHHKSLIKRADYVVDLGPGAGAEGGRVIYSGALEGLSAVSESVTARYFQKGLSPEGSKENARRKSDKYLVIQGARKRNLKEVDVRIPVCALVGVAGVSGSGKSSLIIDTLGVMAAGGSHREAECKAGSGFNELTGVHVINQRPPGKNIRSCPATYCGVFEDIRELFSLLPEARIRGYDAGRFSFNVPGGRCEACEGSGLEKREGASLLDRLPVCSVCEGLRFSRETLRVRFKGHSIGEILCLTVDSAALLFHAIPSVQKRLRPLQQIGLGYLQLGQHFHTLSGGEAQRVKIATSLTTAGTGGGLYLLDEPSRGLHPADVENLENVLHALVDHENTVVIIEHNLQLLNSVDWMLELGPGAGGSGGQLIFCGTPEQVATSGTATGKYLGEYVKGG